MSLVASLHLAAFVFAIAVASQRWVQIRSPKLPRGSFCAIVRADCGYGHKEGCSGCPCGDSDQKSQVKKLLICKCPRRRCEMHTCMRRVDKRHSTISQLDIRQARTLSIVVRGHQHFSQFLTKDVAVSPSGAIVTAWKHRFTQALANPVACIGEAMWEGIRAGGCVRTHA